jgi:hypothetical protein
VSLSSLISAMTQDSSDEYSDAETLALIAGLNIDDLPLTSTPRRPPPASYSASLPGYSSPAVPPTPAASQNDPELATLLASLQLGEALAAPATPARNASPVYQYHSPHRSGITTEW